MRKEKLRISKDKDYELIDGVQVPKAQKLDRDTPARTLAKTISWRIVASLTTFLIFYFSTGQKVPAAIIGTSVLIEALTKMVIYYFHERLWENVNWGKYWMRYGLVRRVKLRYITWKRKRRKFH